MSVSGSARYSVGVVPLCPQVVLAVGDVDALDAKVLENYDGMVCCAFRYRLADIFATFRLTCLLPNFNGQERIQALLYHHHHNSYTLPYQGCRTPRLPRTLPLCSLAAVTPQSEFECMQLTPQHMDP